MSPFYVSGLEGDDLVTLTSSSTILADTNFNFGEPVGITYNSTLIFAQGSFLPEEDDVEDIVRRAFNGGSLNDYLTDLTDLPISNLFSTTRRVDFENGIQARTASSAQGPTLSNVLMGAGAGAGVAALAIVALALSGRRRKNATTRQNGKMSDGHVTVGDLTLDSRSLAERAEETNAMEDVNLD